MVEVTRETPEEDVRREIRDRRARLDAQIASGEKEAKRPLTYDKKGPSIREVGATRERP